MLPDVLRVDGEGERRRVICVGVVVEKRRNSYDWSS